MRRTATFCAALAAIALSGAQAQAGFLFFGNSSSSGSSCYSSAGSCNPAPRRCCKQVRRCCNPAPRCCNSGGGLFSSFKLPKLRLPGLGGSNCCNTAPACHTTSSACGPAGCGVGQGSTGHLSPSAGSSVEDAPAPPPYEDKAPAPAPPKAKDAAPAPAAPAKEAAPAPAKKAAPAAPAKEAAPAAPKA